MSEENLQSIKNLIAEFGDLSLSDFRDAFQPLAAAKDPATDRYLLEQLKNFRGNRSMRAEIAHALAEREDEAYIEDFGLIIEKETDVSLCKECIAALSRIGTPAAIQKIEFLAKSKPNATIASLLGKEIDKIRHEEKEPVAYYLEHLAKGSDNARGCVRASKVLLKIGDPKVVDTILDAFSGYDELARGEAAKVVGQLGQPQHLAPALDLLDRYQGVYEDNSRFLEIMEHLETAPKEERVDLLLANLRKVLPNEIEPGYERFEKAIEAGEIGAAKRVQEAWLGTSPPLGTKYYTESAILIKDAKVAHAAKYHEEALRRARIRQTRLRQLLAQLSYGVGKIAGSREEDDGVRARAVDRLTALVTHRDNDISKMALFGTSFMAEPGDDTLLQATLQSHHLEGMTRLLRALSRKDANFTDFFLQVSLEHEILDIQEMAMHALGQNDEVYGKLRDLLGSESPERKNTAIRIIGEVGAEVFRDDLLALLEGQSDIIRIQAIRSLGKLGDPSVLDAINEVMYDAKSQVLIEACLEGIAAVGGEAGIACLHTFIERTRNRKTAVVAVRHLVDSYRNWNHPLPEASTDLAMTHLQTWFADRDPQIRLEAYQIAGNIISLDPERYKQLKTMFKEASSRLRAQQTWDKNEMEIVEEKVRTVNRSFFFLQDMVAFNDEIANRARNHDHESSATRVAVYEKLLSLLESNEKFLISTDNETLLEGVVLQGLELGGSSWREQSLCFRIAAFIESNRLREKLQGRIKTVPKQARADLLDALTRLGMSLSQLNEATTISRILVLEGSGFYRKRVCKHLIEAGYTVRDSSDPETGLAMIRGEVPDLVITEINFGENQLGAEIAEQIASEYGGRIQLIFSTNSRDASVLERVNKLDPLEVLHKPYPLDDLVAVIKG